MRNKISHLEAENLKLHKNLQNLQLRAPSGERLSIADKETSSIRDILALAENKRKVVQFDEFKGNLKTSC